MGRGRSYEIIEYRKKIITELCSSNEILKLLRCEDEENPEDVYDIIITDISGKVKCLKSITLISILI